MVLVVVLLPVGDDGTSFINVVEGIHVQALVPNATVERFNVSVALWLIGWNVMDTEFVPSEFADRVSDQFGSVIAA